MSCTTRGIDNHGPEDLGRGRVLYAVLIHHRG